MIYTPLRFQVPSFANSVIGKPYICGGASEGLAWVESEGVRKTGYALYTHREAKHGAGQKGKSIIFLFWIFEKFKFVYNLETRQILIIDTSIMFLKMLMCLEHYRT
jgi:hypothetical protein